MERRMSSMTQMEVAKIIADRKAVILPTGATEAHGPHMPTDTDTHQAEYIALELAERIDAVVAPPVAYGISKTFEFFPGTISLSIPTYQTMVFEIGAALIKQGFRHLILLNGNRPSGTANDAGRAASGRRTGQGLRIHRFGGQLLGTRRGADPRHAQIGAGRHGPRLRNGNRVPTRDTSGTGENGRACGCEIWTGRLGPGRADQSDADLYAPAATRCRPCRDFWRSDQGHRRSRKGIHRCGGRRLGGDVQKPSRILSGTALSSGGFPSVDRSIRPPAEVH